MHTCTRRSTVRLANPYSRVMPRLQLLRAEQAKLSANEHLASGMAENWNGQEWRRDKEKELSVRPIMPGKKEEKWTSCVLSVRQPDDGS